MESNTVNWSKILIYGSILFFAQFVTGFAEGFFSPGANGTNGTNGTNNIEVGLWLVLSTLTSFIVSASIFAHMTIYQASRPFMHASLSFILYCVASLGFSMALKPLIGGVPTLLVSLGWLTLVAGFLAGVLIGSAVRRMRAGNKQKGVA